MKKIEKRPGAGGSYTRDAKTGKLTRTHFTEVLPGGAPIGDAPEADAPAPAARQAVPASAPETKEA